MSRKRILLVNDNTALREQLATRCREIGLAVETAHDAVTAVAIIDRVKLDLLCIDGDVPGGDGLCFAEMVLASPDDVDCPVIVLADRIDKPSKSQGTEMCVYHLRNRPDLWRTLESVIYELVDIPPLARRANDEERGVSECIS